MIKSLISLFLISTIFLSGCSSDIKNDATQSSRDHDHICNNNFVNLIDHSQYFEGVLKSFELQPSELFDGKDLIICIENDAKEEFTFFIPESGGWPLDFGRYFMGYYIGQNLRIYYDGVYTSEEVYSAKVKAITDNTEWGNNSIKNKQNEMLNIYNSYDNIKICCKEKAMHSIIEHLELNDLNRKTLDNGFIFYEGDDLQLYCNQIEIVDMHIYFIVSVVSSKGNATYMVEQETGIIEKLA